MRSLHRTTLALTRYSVHVSIALANMDAIIAPAGTTVIMAVKLVSWSITGVHWRAPYTSICSPRALGYVFPRREKNVMQSGWDYIRS